MAKLIAEVENMPDAQKAQLKDMGMDPDTSECTADARRDVARRARTSANTPSRFDFVQCS